MKNLNWEKKIKSAIEEKRIIPFFQPIINNKTGEIEKYETLIRMIDEDKKIISPYLFLQPSKKYKLYNYLTKIMIEKAFEVFKDINKEFSINISVDDILDESTNNFIIKKLKYYKNPERVVFEILESEGIENYSKVMDFIMDIKACGGKIAIDDFGSGYSSFEHILKLNPDYLKIDASMIKNITRDKNSEIITTTIVEFARKIGLKTIAEFVHSEEVYEKVKNIGVDYSQGYYLGEPGMEVK